MRYVNLKKTNTSKFNYMVKRSLIIALFTLTVALSLVIPFTSKQRNLKAANRENDVEIVNNIETNETIENLEIL